MTQAEIIEVLKEHGPMTAPELAEHTGAPLNTIRTYITRLRRKHEIEVIQIEGRTRPGVYCKYRLMARKGV